MNVSRLLSLLWSGLFTLHMQDFGVVEKSSRLVTSNTMRKARAGMERNPSFPLSVRVSACCSTLNRTLFRPRKRCVLVAYVGWMCPAIL